ncbi:hypothetical protein AX15_002062 [Amanita polypyramis BW_CC]|nr:hypothetical protein AX15_002062 [Amanita polypyramis BW_CC]
MPELVSAVYLLPKYRDTKFIKHATMYFLLTIFLIILPSILPALAYNPGDVVSMAPKSWGATGKGRGWWHPCIIIESHEKYYLVAPTSRSLPAGKYPLTAIANHYTVSGQLKDDSPSFVSIGVPEVVPRSKVDSEKKDHKKFSIGTGKLEELVTKIGNQNMETARAKIQALENGHSAASSGSGAQEGSKSHGRTSVGDQSAPPAGHDVARSGSGSQEGDRSRNKDREPASQRGYPYQQYGSGRPDLGHRGRNVPPSGSGSQSGNRGRESRMGIGGEITGTTTSRISDWFHSILTLPVGHYILKARSVETDVQLTSDITATLHWP